jgi:hypothetical protein
MKISEVAKARIVAGLIACFTAQFFIRGLIDGWYELGKHNTYRYTRTGTPDDFWVATVFLILATITALYHCLAPKPTWLIRVMVASSSKQDQFDDE